MSEFRRRLMMVAAQGGGGGNIPPITDYVQNGLVLLLDGIEKGNITGSWVDHVSGYVFTGFNVTFWPNNIQFDGTSSYLAFNTTDSIIPAYNDSSIEIVYADESNTTTSKILFMPNGKQLIAFGTTGGYNIITTSSGGTTYTQPLTSSIISVSATKNNCYLNGSPLQSRARTDSWATPDSNNIYIGKRVNGARFQGRIYSIRIYNRHLSQAEVLSNLAVDNGRFNLGLNLS